MAKSNAMHTFEFSAFPGLSCLHGRIGGHIFPRHCHSSYMVGAVLSGKRKIFSGKSDELICSGEIFMLNPYQGHSCVIDEEQEYVVVSCAENLMVSMASSMSGCSEVKPYFEKLRVQDAALFSLLNELSECAEFGEGGLQAEEIIYSLFLCWLKYGGNYPVENISDQKKKYIERAAEFIRKNYASKIKLQQIAQKAYLSPYYFQKVFIQVYGCSPSEYLDKVRVDNARGLLEDDMDMAQIAISCGFADQSHFCRVFRKITGVNPCNFR